MPNERQPLGWAVIGLGRAGSARIRDITASPDAHLVATVSNRGTGSHTLEQALQLEAVDACIVATANARHAEQARSCLQAGKHTLVEFPLAARGDEAIALFALARDSGLVLHTELIGLLTARHMAMAQCVGEASVESVHCEFQGGLYGWVADEMRRGHLGQLAVGRLHALWDLLGRLRLDEVALQQDKDGYRLDIRMTAERANAVHLVEQRRVGQARVNRLSVIGADGPLEPPSAASGGKGLFARDLVACTERIATANRSGAYVSDDVVIEVVKLAEEISRRASTPT
jgi:predicted dehydrogenase